MADIHEVQLMGGLALNGTDLDQLKQVLVDHIDARVAAGGGVAVLYANTQELTDWLVELRRSYPSMITIKASDGIPFGAVIE